MFLLLKKEPLQKWCLLLSPVPNSLQRHPHNISATTARMFQEQEPQDVVTEGHEKRSDMSRMQTSRPDLLTNSSEPRTQAPVHVEKKVGRNDPCPCGSGKKYKNCHGKEA